MFGALEGANLRGANFERAKADEDTIWPPGFDPEATGVIFKYVLGAGDADTRDGAPSSTIVGSGRGPYWPPFGPDSCCRRRCSSIHRRFFSEAMLANIRDEVAAASTSYRYKSDAMSAIGLSKGTPLSAA